MSFSENENASVKPIYEKIQWNCDADDILVFRHDCSGDSIASGTRLLVNDGKAAVICYSADIGDVFLPGEYILNGKTLRNASAAYGRQIREGEAFCVDICFVDIRPRENLCWHSQNEITALDKGGQPVVLNIGGSYGFRLSNPEVFLRKVFGGEKSLTVQKFTSQLENLIIAGVSGILAEYKVDIKTLADNNNSLTGFIGLKLREKLVEYGFVLINFTIDDIPDDEQPPSASVAAQDDAPVPVQADAAEQPIEQPVEQQLVYIEPVEAVSAPAFEDISAQTVEDISSVTFEDISSQTIEETTNQTFEDFSSGADDSPAHSDDSPAHEVEAVDYGFELSSDSILQDIAAQTDAIQNSLNSFALPVDRPIAEAELQQDFTDSAAQDEPARFDFGGENVVSKTEEFDVSTPDSFDNKLDFKLELLDFDFDFFKKADSPDSDQKAATGLDNTQAEDNDISSYSQPDRFIPRFDNFADTMPKAEGDMTAAFDPAGFEIDIDRSIEDSMPLKAADPFERFKVQTSSQPEFNFADNAVKSVSDRARDKNDYSPLIKCSVCGKMVLRGMICPECGNLTD